MHIPMLIAAALLLAPASRNDRWRVIGPGGGGTMYAPLISPHNSSDVLVHCDMTGTYLSRDGGSSWRMFNLRGRTRFYLFDPLDPNVIYVQTVALWRSTDRGRTWALVHPGPAAVTGIQMPDDHAGERILAPGAPGGPITALAVDPKNSKTLYAALRDSLHVSTDWGRTWKKSGDLPFAARGIYVDPGSPKADRSLYVIGASTVALRERGEWRRGEPPPGVTAFHDVSAGFPPGGGPLIVYATAPAGAFVSEDGGRTWRQIALPDLKFRPNFPAVAASLHHPNVAYLSYDNGRTAPERMFGIARTADGGRTWTPAWTQADTNPPRNREAWMTERNGAGWGRNPDNLGVAPGDPNLCFGTDSMRTMRTRDGGRNWEAVYSASAPDGGWVSTGLDVTTCYGVHFDPFDPKRMLISYTDIGQYRSENGGQSWLLSTQGIPREWRNTTYWVVFDPEVKGRLWGVMSYVHDLPRPKMWQGRSPSTYVGGICRSEDGARSWNCMPGAIPDTAPTHILLDPNSPANARVLYVAAFGRGVYKSTDDGQTWAPKNNGIAGAEPLAWRLAQDRSRTLYLVAARRSQDGSFGNDGDGALYRSTDGAEHWSRIDLPPGVNGPNGLAIDPENPKRLYLAAWGRRTPDGAVDGGIFVSDNGGAGWRNVLAKDQHVYDVTIDPRDPRILYACGFSSSAWRSTDRGESWRRIRGYNFKWGHRVIPDPVDPGKVYITTFGGSVWHGPAAGDPQAPEDIQTPVV
ncbi:MAG: hypothetical protein AAB225_31605, partial [Acidobacteriota bacterium]